MFERYRKLTSLREYVLVSRNEAAIDRYRLENGHWILHELRGEDAIHSLQSAGIGNPLREHEPVPFFNSRQAVIGRHRELTAGA